MLKNISRHINKTLNKATHHLNTVMMWLKKPVLKKATNQTKINRQSLFYEFIKNQALAKNTLWINDLSKNNLVIQPTFLKKYCQFGNTNNDNIAQEKNNRYGHFFVITNIAKKTYYLNKNLDKNSALNLFFYCLNTYHHYYKHYPTGKYSSNHNHIAKQRSLIVYEDSDMVALKLEISSLENELGNYDSERAELEKLLADFNHRHLLELGDIIGEILALKKQLAKHNDDDIAFEEMHNFEQSYHEQLQEEKQKIRHPLTNDDKKLLKKLYRKASSLCHPDRVNDKQKALAEELFTELRQAYEENDLAKVKQLLTDLEKGIFEPRSKSISQKEKLKGIKEQIQGKLRRIINAINDIKKSPSYQEIMEIEDWDIYFAEQKTLLIQEKERLKERLKETILDKVIQSSNSS